MADDQNPVPAGQAPATTPPAAPEPTATQPANPDGQEPTQEEPFDRDRALATIRKLRGFEKTANELERQLTEYKRKEEDARLAALSEQERLAEQKKALEAELASERKTAQDRSNRYEVQLHAARLGIVDPEAAEKLLNWSDLEYAADGKPKDVEGALKALITERPWLKGAAPTQPGTQTPPAVSPTNGPSRQTAPGQRVYTVAEIADRDFYVKNRDDIILAMRQGRVRQQ